MKLNSEAITFRLKSGLKSTQMERNILIFADNSLSELLVATQNCRFIPDIY